MGAAGAEAELQSLPHLCPDLPHRLPALRAHPLLLRKAMLHDLHRQTMSNWVLRAAEDHLLPVYEELRRQLVKREVLHADETTLQVLHEPGKKAQTKSYMWLYRTGQKIGFSSFRRCFVRSSGERFSNCSSQTNS